MLGDIISRRRYAIAILVVPSLSNIAKSDEIFHEVVEGKHGQG